MLSWVTGLERRTEALCWVYGTPTHQLGTYWALLYQLNLQRILNHLGKPVVKQHLICIRKVVRITPKSQFTMGRIDSAVSRRKTEIELVSILASRHAAVKKTCVSLRRIRVATYCGRFAASLSFATNRELGLSSFKRW